MSLLLPETAPAATRRGFLITVTAAGAVMGFAAESDAATAAPPGYAPTIWYDIARDGTVTVHVTRAESPLVPQAVAMGDRPLEHVGDGLDAAMRMPGKAREIVLGALVAEIVEQQKRIELGGIAESEGTPELDPRSLHRGPGFGDSLNRTYRHGC